MKKDSKNLTELANKNEDYYLDENGLMVFTKHYHLKRGYCCRNGCKHCPYGFKK